MNRRPAARAARYAVAGTVVTLLLGATSSASPTIAWLPSRTDLVGSAHPTAKAPTVVDDALRTDTLSGLKVRADTVATASAGCDGCRGRAVAVHVVRAGWAWRVRADNVATSWASCHGCAAETVTVQLVLVRRPATLVVNNRALAVTAACQECIASATAYQLVVQAAPGPDDLPGLADTLAGWARQQPAATGATPEGSPPAGRLARESLDGLERAVHRTIGGTVLRSRVAHRSG